MIFRSGVKILMPVKAYGFDKTRPLSMNVSGSVFGKLVKSGSDPAD
jgi:hypothetical protein